MSANQALKRRYETGADVNETGPVSQLADGSRFARSRDGKTIHLASCHLAAAGVPWRWADDKTDHDVAWQILGTSWLRACKRCMGGMADAL